MYQRRRVLQLWEEAGLKKSRNKQVREFIAFVEKNPGLGWKGYVDKCRQDYPQAIKMIVPPLLESADPLITVNLLRSANLKRKIEKDIVTKFAQEADVDRHAVALEFLAKIGDESIKKTLEQRAALPGRVKQFLVEEKLVRTGRLPAPDVTPGTRHSIG